MGYIGNSPANVGNFQVVDDISSTFNGVLTSFALTALTLPINPAKSGQLLVSINGVLQEPDDTGTEGFKVSGSNIVFSSAPATGSTFWAVWQGQAVDIGTPSDGTVGTAQMSSAELALTGGLSLGDNVKAKFGDSDDLQIHHNGGGSVIADVGNGNLSLQSNGAEVTMWDLANSQHMAQFKAGAEVSLRHNGEIKLATTSTGIDVTGVAKASTLSLSGTTAFSAGTISQDVNWGMYFKAATAGAAAEFSWVNSTGSERLRINSSGNVGIGTSILNSNKAVIEGGAAGTHSSTLALKTGDDANSKVADLAFYGTFVTPTSDKGQRRTADITSGFSTANWGTEYLAFGVGGASDAANVTSEKMRIDSSGNVSVVERIRITGSSNTHGIDIVNANGRIYFGGNRAIEGAGSNLSLGEGYTNVSIHNANLSMSAGKGIDFSANGNAAGMTSELLDDYEEGTWSPVLTDLTTDATMVGGNTGASYTKVGNTVSVTGFMQTSSLTGLAGNISIRGLPFSAINGNPGYAVISIGQAWNMVLTAGEGMSMQISGGGTVAQLRLWDHTSGNTAMVSTEWGTSGYLGFSGTYTAN